LATPAQSILAPSSRVVFEKWRPEKGRRQKKKGKKKERNVRGEKGKENTKTSDRVRLFADDFSPRRRFGSGQFRTARTPRKKKKGRRARRKKRGRKKRRGKQEEGTKAAQRLF